MTDIHQRLARDHAQLAATFDEYQQELASQGSRGAELCADFESRLLAHMEGEEKYLFPVVVKEFNEEVVALREEHEDIRRHLADLAESPLDQSLVAQLAVSLGKHARRENGMLYQLANAAESSPAHRELIEFLDKTYASLRQASD